MNQDFCIRLNCKGLQLFSQWLTLFSVLIAQHPTYSYLLAKICKTLFSPKVYVVLHFGENIVQFLGSSWFTESTFLCVYSEEKPNHWSACGSNHPTSWVIGILMCSLHFSFLHTWQKTHSFNFSNLLFLCCNIYHFESSFSDTYNTRLIYHCQQLRSIYLDKNFPQISLLFCGNSSFMAWLKFWLCKYTVDVRWNMKMYDYYVLCRFGAIGTACLQGPYKLRHRKVFLVMLRFGDRMKSKCFMGTLSTSPNEVQ